jgi:hypothetical protein
VPSSGHRAAAGNGSVEGITGKEGPEESKVGNTSEKARKPLSAGPRCRVTNGTTEDAGEWGGASGRGTGDSLEGARANSNGFREVIAATDGRRGGFGR